jgi:hypothetical protein
MTLQDYLDGFKLLMGGGDSPTYSNAFLAAANDTVRDLTVRLRGFTQGTFTDLTDEVDIEDYQVDAFRGGIEYFLARNYGEAAKEISEAFAIYRQGLNAAMMGTYYA